MTQNYSKSEALWTGPVYVYNKTSKYKFHGVRAGRPDLSIDTLLLVPAGVFIKKWNSNSCVDYLNKNKHSIFIDRKREHATTVNWNRQSEVSRSKKPVKIKIVL